MMFDIIYVNYNSTACLIQSIESLFEKNRTNLKLNVIVVDNCSHDNPRKLKSLYPDITFIQNRENRGFGSAINQAMVHCRSKYIVLLNPDSLVPKGFFETCLRYMEQNPATGVMGPQIINEDGTVQGSARSFPNPLTALFGRKSPITKWFPNNSISKANMLNLQGYNAPMEVNWVSGACMIVRREAMQAVNGFDERFFLYWEDTDLCQRISAAGWKVVYNPEPSITHFVGQSSKTRPFFSSYQFHKSSHILYAKYAKWPFTLVTPLVGISLMLRFLFVSCLNGLAGAFTYRNS